MILQGLKIVTLDGEYAIDNLPIPNKEAAKLRLRAQEARQAQQLQMLLKENPDIGQKLIEKQVGIRGKH